MSWLLLILVIILGISGVGYLAYIKKIHYGVAIALFPLAIYGVVHYHTKYELYHFEQIHNNDMVLAYIDSMTVQELRNKLKACQLNADNCTIVFAQQK